MTGPAQPDPTTSTPPAAPAGEPAKQPETDETGDKPLGETGQRAFERVKAERAALAAEIERLKPLAEKLAALEEAGKTETQRERDARETAEKRLAELELRTAKAERGLLASKIATELGRADVAEWLRGDDEEQLRADAERLIALLPTGAGTPAPVRRDASAGGSNPSTPDMNALLRIAAGRGA